MSQRRDNVDASVAGYQCRPRFESPSVQGLRRVVMPAHGKTSFSYSIVILQIILCALRTDSQPVHSPVFKPLPFRSRRIRPVRLSVIATQFSNNSNRLFNPVHFGPASTLPASSSARVMIAWPCDVIQSIRVPSWRTCAPRLLSTGWQTHAVPVLCESQCPSYSGQAISVRSSSQNHIAVMFGVPSSLFRCKL